MHMYKYTYMYRENLRTLIDSDLDCGILRTLRIGHDNSVRGGLLARARGGAVDLARCGVYQQPGWKRCYRLTGHSEHQIDRVLR